MRIGAGGLLVALLAGLAACTTLSRITHVGAQDRFEKLFVRKQNCPAGAAGAACRESAESELLDLAGRARASAADESDEARRIRLLRVAGTAAWQGGSRGTPLAVEIAEEAVPRCRALEERARTQDTPPAPVDCALLEILPGLVTHTRYLEDLAAIAALRPTEASTRALARIVERYPADTFLAVQAHQEWATAYTALGRRGRTYVETSRRVLFCDYRRVAGTVDAHERYREALDEAMAAGLARAPEATGLDFAVDCPSDPRLLPPPPF